MLYLWCACSAASPAEDTPAAIEQQAVNLIQASQAKTASTLLQKAVATWPRDVNLWNLLGISLTEAGDFAAAQGAFQRGLGLAPGSADLNENIGLLFFREADYGNAKKYLDTAVKRGSKNPGVLFSLAASRLRTGEPDRALTDLISLESSLSGSSEYWTERGRAELLHNPGAASGSFDRALALSPDSPSILNEAATAAEKQALDEKALAYLVRAKTVAPSDVGTLLHFGSVCIRRDLGPDARDALEKAYHLDPSNNTALYLLARANVSLQNWQEAYDLFAKFSQRVPKYAPVYYAMGWLDVRLNRPEDARVKLEHALALDGALSGARYELARLQFDDGQLDAAENSLRQVVANNKHDARADMTLGEIMLRRGRLEESEKLLNAAIQEDPRLAAAHYQLSLLLFRTHENERAQQERGIAAKLTEEERRASKTQLRLILPDSDNVH